MGWVRIGFWQHRARTAAEALRLPPCNRFPKAPAREQTTSRPWQAIQGRAVAVCAITTLRIFLMDPSPHRSPMRVGRSVDKEQRRNFQIMDRIRVYDRTAAGRSCPSRHRRATAPRREMPFPMSTGTGGAGFLSMQRQNQDAHNPNLNSRANRFRIAPAPCCSHMTSGVCRSSPQQVARGEMRLLR